MQRLHCPTHAVMRGTFNGIMICRYKQCGANSAIKFHRRAQITLMESASYVGYIWLRVFFLVCAGLGLHCIALQNAQNSNDFVNE